MDKKSRGSGSKGEETGHRIRLARDKMGFTQAELASQLGYQPLALSRWERGERHPSLDDLSRLADILSINLHWLLTGEGSPFAIREDQTDDEGNLVIPLMGEVGAGQAAEYYAPADQEGVLQLPIKILPWDLAQYLARRPDQFFALRVISDSMVPRIHPGDIVIIHLEEWDPGQIVVVRIHRTDHMVKRFLDSKEEGKAYLVSENTDYPPIEVDCDVEVLGRVVFILSLQNLDD